MSTRRKFLKVASLASAGFTIVPRHVLGRGFTAPSDKINLGIIGLGKQGNILARLFVENTAAQIVAGSEVWTGKREQFKSKVEALYAEKRNVSNYSGVATYLDSREMNARPDIDGVIVATPDHWHSLQAIDAMRAGKDVYCEKPLTNTIKEGRALVKAAKKNNAVFQVGSMQRSWDRFKKAQQVVSSGQLGTIQRVLVSVGDPARPYDLPGEAVPQGLDWNRWCGPAPLLPYHDTVAPREVKSYPDWRNYRATGGGLLSDWGAHMFDIAQWCLGMDDTAPIRYVPPTDPTAVRGLRMEYANGIEMVHENFGRGNAVRFIGSEGSLDVSRKFLDSDPADLLASTFKPGEDTELANHNNHYQDWLTAMRTRGTTICPAEVGHRTATVCNVANIAYWLNRPLDWNPKRERFRGDREANRLRGRDDRSWEQA